MTALSLPEFILARVAEDEAGEVVHRKIGNRTRIERDEPSERWLRECEAKKRLMEAVSGLSGQWYDYIDDRVLRILAAIWSDHPDYRKEWAAWP